MRISPHCSSNSIRVVNVYNQIDEITVSKSAAEVVRSAVVNWPLLIVLLAEGEGNQNQYNDYSIHII